MANAIESFTPEYKQLAMPAATTLVYIDGVLCEDLAPVQIVRSSWPEFGWARLAYHPAAQSDLERIEDRFAMGRTVCLRQLYNKTPTETAIAGLSIFFGRIESIKTTIDNTNEAVEIVAKDFSSVLDRITVLGQHVLQNDGSTMLLEGLDTTFNPAGRANAALDLVSDEDKNWTAFRPNAAQAKSWDYAGVISYLLGTYLPGGCLHWPDPGQLRALTDGRLVRDLDVTGLSLLDALRQVCKKAGIQFRFVPRLVETGPSQAIVFYRNGKGRSVELNCQPVGRTISLSRTNITSLQSKRTFYPITHRYIGQGDFKTYEATFALVPAWDPGLEDTNYYRFSPSTNPDFSEVRDVYRKWCLNEAGDYSDEPYDFSKVFEGGPYVPRHRRFWPAMNKGAHGRSLGYYLEVSYDAGAHWRRYPHAFNNLLDECGLWLSSDQLDVSTWVAALKSVLKFRVTASVVSDERITSVIADGPIGSTAPVIDHVLTLPRQFQYRKVSKMSIFAQTNARTLDRPDEVDDTASLHDFVRSQAGTSASIIETTQIQTPALMLHLNPGDRVVSSPDSRDLLSCRRDNRSVVWVERVQVDFQKQCTRLSLARRRQS